MCVLCVDVDVKWKLTGGRYQYVIVVCACLSYSQHQSGNTINIWNMTKSNDFLSIFISYLSNTILFSLILCFIFRVYFIVYLIFFFCSSIRIGKSKSFIYYLLKSLPLHWYWKCFSTVIFFFRISQVSSFILFSFHFKRERKGKKT